MSSGIQGQLAVPSPTKGILVFTLQLPTGP